jgi:DNA-directed RNA polymerase subunit RPC12/RpoP
VAEGRLYVCTNCQRQIEAWDEGNPYYLTYPERTKHYAYHPHPDRSRCTHVDTPVLCLSCGTESMSDSARPLTTCPDCGNAPLLDTWRLEGVSCPTCGHGVFRADPNGYMIS